MSGASSKKLCKRAGFNVEGDNDVWIISFDSDNGDDINDADEEDDNDVDNANTIGVSDVIEVERTTLLDDDSVCFSAEPDANFFLLATISLFFSSAVNVFISSRRILKKSFWYVHVLVVFLSNCKKIAIYW